MPAWRSWPPCCARNSASIPTWRSHAARHRRRTHHLHRPRLAVLDRRRRAGHQLDRPAPGSHPLRTGSRRDRRAHARRSLHHSLGSLGLTRRPRLPRPHRDRRRPQAKVSPQSAPVAVEPTRLRRLPRIFAAHASGQRLHEGAARRDTGPGGHGDRPQNGSVQPICSPAMSPARTHRVTGTHGPSRRIGLTNTFTRTLPGVGRPACPGPPPRTRSRPPRRRWPRRRR